MALSIYYRQCMITRLNNTDNNCKKLTRYLCDVNKDFEIPLSNKVNLTVYSQKLLTYGIVLVSINGDIISGLLAGYCNDAENGNAIISLLSVKKEFRGRGISRLLIKKMISECKKAGMNSILVDSVNPIAVTAYASMGFIIDSIESIGITNKTFLHFQL